MIDDNERAKALQNYNEGMAKIKSNKIPKSVISLEKAFDLQDKFKSSTNVKTNNSTMRYEIINLGMKKDPNTVNLVTSCTEPRSKLTSNYSNNVKMFSPRLMRT